MIKFLAMIFLALNLNAADGKDKADIAGLWITESQDTIKIVEENGIFNGYLEGIGEYEGNPDELSDENNIDKKLRNRKLKGIKLISGLDYSGTEWKNGKIYIPEIGESFDCNICNVEHNVLIMEIVFGELREKTKFIKIKNSK